MMYWGNAALVSPWLAYQQYGVAAQPTWPASTDELEDIMFLNSGYRARGFAAPVTPCSAGVAAGRITAAEFIRTAFHDMASGNTYTGVGGLDGSIVFETSNAENVGAGFISTLNLYAPYFSSRTSISDIIAAGVYTATRSCGGPVIPIRGGRKDATVAGPSDQVPLPQNALGTFKNQFLRMGYNATEMISFVACGHTLGGVHASNFPDIVPAGTATIDFATFDTTSSTFDSRLPVEFVAGTTNDPLVKSNTKKNSDTVVFTSDTNNATIKSMQDSTTFANICKMMFQRMIEVVPSGVALTDPIMAYDVKPYDIQLTLQDGGTTLRFTGDIRVRTTQRSVAQVQLSCKDRNGETMVDSISTTYAGDAKGFDDAFSFFSFDAQLSADSSISSFNVVITVSGGTTETFTNNGNGFKVDDSIIYQAPQSCLDSTGKLTVVAAVRNISSTSPTMTVVVQNPRSGVIIPALSTATAAMATQSAVGAYQLYSASYQLSGTQADSAEFSVAAGTASDDYKKPSSLPTACSPLSSSTPTTTPSGLNYTFQGCYYDAGVPRALAAVSTSSDSMSVETCANYCKQYQLFGLEYGRECYCGNALDTSTVIKGLSDCNMACSGVSNETCGAASRISTYKNLKYTAPVIANVAGYSYLGCYSEGTNSRALADSSTASDTMTVESCATFCDGATYFGLEYGRECYCGSQIQGGSTLQPATDCSMLCVGNSTEYCGASYRLNVYEKELVLNSTLSTTSSTSTTSSGTKTTTSSTSSLTPSSTAMSFSSTISLPSDTPDTSSTSPSTSSTTFPPSTIQPTSSSSSSSSSSPSSTLASTTTEASITSRASTSSTTAPSSTTSSTPSSTPTLTNYTYLGCTLDSASVRLLTSKSTSSPTMTYALCANFCTGYAYLGLEYASECYCGITLNASLITMVGESECDMVCSGSATGELDICGAAERLTLFKSDVVTTEPTNPLILGYTYAGCYTDDVNNRALGDKYLFDAGMTVEECAEFCNGSAKLGTEYGGECYCGSRLGNGTGKVEESECGYICGGDNGEFCGGESRLSVYGRDG